MNTKAYRRRPGCLVYLAIFFTISACGPGQEDRPRYDRLEKKLDTHVTHSIVEPGVPEGKIVNRVVLEVQDSAEFQEDILPDSSYQHHATAVWAYWPDENYEDAETLIFGRYEEFGWPYLKFDITGSIPEDAEVVQSVLSLYVVEGYGQDQNGAAHKVLTDWDEATLTYNNQPTDWQNEDYETIVYLDGLGWWDWDISQMTQEWVDDPASNFGVSILPIDALYWDDRLYFCGDEYSSTSLRPKLTIDYLIPEHRAEYLEQSAPSTELKIGQQVQVSVRFRNDGGDTWTVVDGYKLGSQAPQDNANWGMSRIDLPNDVSYESDVEFSFQVTAPTQPGIYTFQWQMLHEGVMWFGDMSDPVDVTVSKLSIGDPCSNPSECDSGECVDGVCCDAHCAGTCLHCNLPGRAGLCSHIPNGEDPDEECAGEAPCGSYCDGGGACAYPAQGTPCADCATCDGAGSCSQYLEAGSDPSDVCGICRVCPGDGPDCVSVQAGLDPHDECTATAPETCSLDGDCDGQGACAFHPQDTVCDPARCEDNIHHPADLCDGAGNCVDSGEEPCVPYVCLDAVNCRTDCSGDEHCIAGSHCDGGQCVAYLQRGEACSQDAECITSYCTDGVCCDVPCDGLCEACNLPADPGGCLAVPDGEDPREDCDGTGLCGGVCDGSRGCRFPPADLRCAVCTSCDGAGFCAQLAEAGSDPYDDCQACMTCSGVDDTCVNVPDGEDPLEDCIESEPQSCGTDGLCDGGGACRLYAQGAVCVEASCTDGVLAPADLCDGEGNCLESGLTDCEGYTCLGSDACRTECAADEGCLPGFHCDQPECQADRETGSACERDGQCVSGHCADGVCCSSACDGTCERCDLAGSVGTCALIPEGLDPDSECGEGGPCAGKCDGAGSCVLPGEEKSCGPCARCDGAGGCTVFLEEGTDPDDACGPCRVCAGGRDECVAVAAGEDPLEECTQQAQNDCGLDGFCDGRGACRLWPAGTLCGQQTCVGDTLSKAPTCDGQGNCVERGSVSCAPYVCDGDNCAGPAGLHHVSIEDAAGGVGQKVGDLVLTTDDSLVLYAVGRDSSGAFLDDVVVRWVVEGEIGTIQPGPSRSAGFDPTTPGNGYVTSDFHDPQVVDGSTGQLAVGPGVAAGEVPLQAEPTLIPADGTSTAVVVAGPVEDADGNPVADGTLLTVLVSAGSLVGDDEDPGLSGFQRATESGVFSFMLRSDEQPASALVRVTAVPPGTARGEVRIYFGDGKPVADAGQDQEVYRGQIVALDGSASFDPYGRQLSFDWRQKEGPEVELTGAETPAPSFTAPSITGPETMIFELTVSAGVDESATDEVSVSIPGEEDGLPVAVISLEPRSGPAPLDVLMDGRNSTASEGATLVDFLWLFADDAPSLRSQSATRNYPVPGTYGVKLLVTDSTGLFDLAADQVTVTDGEGQPPLLQVTAVPMRGEAPLDVQFVATASDPDGTIDSIEWDFGDGFTETGESQQRLFRQAGHHLIRVRATDNIGLTALERVDIFATRDGIFPPSILSLPPLEARVGEEYRYKAVAVGTSPVTWSLGKNVGGDVKRAPEGMSVVEDSGQLSWVPASSQAGAVEVTLVARNEAGTDFQDFVVEVQDAGSAGGCSCATHRTASEWIVLAGIVFGLIRLRRRSSRR